MQQPSAVGSFFRFLLGFCVFIAVFFIVTVAVQNTSEMKALEEGKGSKAAVADAFAQMIARPQK